LDKLVQIHESCLPR